MEKITSTLLVISIFIGSLSCNESDPATKLTVSETRLELKKNESKTVNIQSGNGGYRIEISDPKIVKTVMLDNKITVTATEIGLSNIKVTDKENETATISVNVSHDVDGANMITFDASSNGGLKKGNIGFLHSIHTDAPVDSFVTLIKPKLWRVGVYNDPFNLYHRLKNNIGVERQLLILSGFRREGPFKSVFDQQGFGAMSEALLLHLKDVGINDYEFDIYNEPNHIQDFDMDAFMRDFWNPGYQAIKKHFPDAKIHGPSHGINTYGDFAEDSTFVYEFIDAAIEHNTLPDYINWHLQVGYNMADWHMDYAEKIEQYINSKGHSISGFVVGESIRPGSERNTSPGVLIDMFLSAEVGDIPQIRAAWSSSLIYGVSTARVPVLCGILTGEDGKGRRGAWWTYRFFAETEGIRIETEERVTGSENLVGLAYKNNTDNVVRALVGLRDRHDRDAYTDLNTLIAINNLNSIPYISKNGKTRVKMWYNYQTENSVDRFGSDYLPLVMDMEVDIINNKIELPVRIYRWDAVLIELSQPQ